MSTALTVIGLFAAGQGFLLAVVLLTKKTNRVANRLLGLFIGIFSLGLVYAVFIITGAYRFLPNLIGVTYPFPLAYGPLWYLYARSLTNGNTRLRKMDLLHFLPFVMGYGILFPYLLRSAEWKVDLIEHFAEQVPLPLSVGNLLMTIQGIVYLFLTIALLRRHLKRLLDFFSEIESLSLRWLRNITVITGAVWVVIAVFQILRFAGIPVLANISPVVAALTSVFVFYTGYMGIRQPGVFEPADHATIRRESLLSQQLSESRAPEATSPNRYSKSGLSEARKEQILEKLQEYLETAKPYLKSSLTLKDLADALSVSEHNLSEVINTGLGQTFFDMVNTYRVLEVQKRLKDPANSNFTLTAIAFDSGFNSKSSFNSVFRRIAGQTPSAFKQSIRESGQ